MKTIKKIIFILFLVVAFTYSFIIISPKFFKNFYPFGIKTAIVLTGSMEPVLEINDFVVIKKPKDIKVNDIISYDDNGEKEVLHRVVKIDGETITTKGDANNTEDIPINIKQVTGVYIGKIKYLGNIIAFITRPIVFSVVIAIIMVIIIIPTKK